MNKKYLRLDQMEVFRPMTVPDALKRQIRSDSEKAKALCRQVQQEHKQLTAQEAVFLRP
jgi:CRISPR/Cas system-associated endonuclease Cas1